jgi:hypothetical protein
MSNEVSPSVHGRACACVGYVSYALRSENSAVNFCGNWIPSPSVPRCELFIPSANTPLSYTKLSSYLALSCYPRYSYKQVNSNNQYLRRLPE